MNDEFLQPTRKLLWLRLRRGFLYHRPYKLKDCTELLAALFEEGIACDRFYPANPVNLI